LSTLFNYSSTAQVKGHPDLRPT
ncbi:uncharacterized protein METZ01_LOCUS481190, partial [marine metagenome]